MSEGQRKRGTANRGNKQESLQREKDYSLKDISKSYNKFKEFDGKKYTGMRVGGHHKWYYDKGEWEEKKTAPDRWEFTYAVNKRRAGHAPEGSGAPVGTEYHWYILADQIVRKLDANNYTTSMIGFKYKLAHKRAEKGKWNITDNTQKQRLIRILQELIGQLRSNKPLEAFEGLL
jgi:hypothetical protein